MRFLALLFGSTLLLAQDEEPGKPVLVHADAICFLHALRATPDASAGRVERVVGQGLALVHTVRTTGEMTVLVPATGVVAIPTRRISFSVTRILGVAADKELLFVLAWSAGHSRQVPQDPSVSGHIRLDNVGASANLSNGVRCA